MYGNTGKMAKIDLNKGTFTVEDTTFTLRSTWEAEPSTTYFLGN
jgi:hypothetical protein